MAAPELQREQQKQHQHKKQGSMQVDSYSLYSSGYNGDFYNQGYYIAGNGVDPQYTVVQADGGSYVYLMPGFYPGYDAYTPYMPYSMIGVDGQYVGQQIFSPMFQSSIPSPEYRATSIPHGDLVQAPYLWGSSLLIGDGALENGYVGVLGIPDSKPIFPSSPISPAFPQSKSSKNSVSTNVSLDVFAGQNKKLKPLSKALSPVSTLQSDLPAQGYYAVAKFPICNHSVSLTANVKGWAGTEKTKTRSKDTGVNEVDVLNEKDHAFETINAKSALKSGGHAVESLASDEVVNPTSIASPIRRDQYNLPEFSTNYDHAFFFVIKSYSEDDVHKSIKYNVWASTPNGNKKLNNAFLDAQERMAEKGSKCPVFLFFSVNASGQFCGVAEMTGQVDFNKSMDFWQQSKWNGYFPVKWHIIKDVPNSQLRHVILENNENKPVTNSRDTQEVKFDRGMEMLSILKNYTSNTSILDDFDFYENRQKIMQEKRIRQSFSRCDLQPKVDELSAGLQSAELSVKGNEGK